MTSSQLEAVKTTVSGERQMTKEEANVALLAALASVAGATRVHEAVGSGIRDHKETYFVKPENKTHAEGAEIFAKAAADEAMVEPYVHTFKHRPWDVALAFISVCKEVFGNVPTAKKPSRHPMTGELIYHSHNIEIPTGPRPGETVSIPYGTVEFLPLQADVEYSMQRDRKLGIVGQVSITTARKNHDSARGLCKLVEKYLSEHSIYKGKAITTGHEPVFLDPWTATNRNEIIWTKEVDAALRGSIINVIRYTDRAKQRRQKIHRSVLFKGDPGNGKSETLNILAQICVENGWTYILGTGTLADALHQARMYAPSVIALEDFERLVEAADAQQLSELLEELDGTSSKSHDIMLVTTSNFVNDLNQRIRRRMAKEIEFGPFDAEACARYLRVRLHELADEKIDYEVIAQSMDGWGNSYIGKVVEFASGLALEHPSPKLTTQDLLDASSAQRPDWEAYKASQIRPEPNRFDEAFKEIVRGQVIGRVIEENSEGELVVVK